MSALDNIIEFAEKMECPEVGTAKPKEAMPTILGKDEKELWPSGRPKFNLNAKHPFGMTLLGVGDFEAAEGRKIEFALTSAGLDLAEAGMRKRLAAIGDTRLLKRAQDLGMEHALYPGRFFPNARPSALAVAPSAATSTQVRAPLAAPLEKYPTLRSPNPNAPPPVNSPPLPRPEDIVSPDTLNIPPQPEMSNEERLSLLTRLQKIRDRNALRQAALRQSRITARGSSYFPERGDISAGI
jgi:hypothetical protein